MLFQMTDEGHNVVTMMLPEGIEILRKRQEQESTTPSQVNDVEYYDGYEEDIESTSEESYLEAGKNDRKLPEPFTVDLWNGLPVLPSFEDFEVEDPT
jgi:hypothetical protein